MSLLKHTFLMFSIIFSASSIARDKPVVVFDSQDIYDQSKLCWYDNKRYTEGAIIQIGQSELVCAAKHTHFNNSELSWLRIDKDGNIMRPRPAKTIRVN